MRIDQFIYLVEIAKFGSISLAAENLHISQPTISQAINALEEELGKKLFYRSRLGTKPTEEGKIIIKKAREILNKIEEIRDEANHNSKLLTGTLSIAAVPSFCLSLLPKVLVEYKEKYPGVSITIFEGGTPEIEKNVLSGKIDLGFTATSVQSSYDSHKELDFNYLSKARVIACVGQKSSLSAFKSISFEEIIKHPFVTYKPEYKLYQRVIKEASKYGEPNILFQSGNTTAGKQIIAEGIGVGFCSDMIIPYDPYFVSKKLVPIPILDADINLYYGWIKLKNRNLIRTGKEFVKVLQNYLNFNF